MIFENFRAVGVQQTRAQRMSIPAQRKTHYVIGKIDLWLTRHFRVDGLGHTDNFVAQLFSSPIALRDSIVGESSGGIVRVNVAVAALQEELRLQMLRQVDWARTMVSMRAMKVKTVVELGPGRVLASLAAKHIPGVDTWNAEELFIDFA